MEEQTPEKVNNKEHQRDQYRESFNFRKESFDEKESLREEERKLIEDKLDNELEKMEVESDHLEEDIKIEKEQIENLKKKGKINRLLNIAKTKGVAYAVAVAKKMNDPYLVDILHDILAHKGFYNKFQK